jgi:ribonucleotide reductase alpha subunit
VLHISTERELALFRSGLTLKDKKVTAEACIHHLWFTDADYARLGSLIKWNPAVKSAADRAAIRAALLDGTIDVVATDHAPHTREEKALKYRSAPSGGPLVQHALLAMIELVHQGVLPIDSLDLLARHRGGHVEVDRSSTMDWNALRERIAQHGMRNSNCVAIAPTATISNIIGVDASIEPCFGNISVKSNLSGEFTVVNEYLVRDLKRLGLWDSVMVSDLKHFDGSLRRIDRVPEELKQLYATAFEVEPVWLVEAASRRQKWIDQAQSLNIYMAGASGKKLDETYRLAWLRGLKTTYYLRTMGATHAEKSTVHPGALNSVPSGGGVSSSMEVAAAKAQSQMAQVESTPGSDVKFCSIDNPDCEACQ